jgi:hypothetical protein
MILIPIRAAVAALAVMMLLTGCSSPADDGAANKRSGQTVVVALGAYMADHAAYAATLAELAPKYLVSIPALRGSASWSYQPKDGGANFDLAFVGKGSTWTGNYSSRGRAWVIDDK